MDFSFQKGIIRSSRGIFQASAQPGPSSLLGGPTMGRSAGRAASGPQINRLTPRVCGSLSRRVFEPAREIARPPHTERSGDGCLSLYQRICKAQTDLSNELWWVGVSLSLPNFNFASMGVAERKGRGGLRWAEPHICKSYSFYYIGAPVRILIIKRVYKSCVQRCNGQVLVQSYKERRE